MNKNITINYEQFKNLINKDHKIINIFKNVINETISSPKLDFNKKIDRHGNEYSIIKKDSKVYQSKYWFYPDGYNSNPQDFFIQSNYCFDINTASILALYKCGGIHAYRIIHDIKLLILNQKLVNKIIKKFIDPLIRKSIKHESFYQYIKIYLKLEMKIESSLDLKEVKNIKSNEISGDFCTSTFLSFISHILGYQGILYTKKGGIYDLSKNGFKILINDKNIFKRDVNNKYDWINWGINEYILPIEEFNLNTVYNNVGFNVYNFYRSNLQYSIKVSEEYDFGTLNVNKLVSINKLYDKDHCIKAIIIFIKTHKLKFICIQDILYKDVKTFNKFVMAENLYSSIGDFEKHNFTDNDLCNIVVSTSKLIIIDISLFIDSRQYFVVFKHPNFRNITFVNTKLNNIKQLRQLTDNNSNYILGNFDIIKGTSEYKYLQSIGYALNNDQIFGTNVDNTQTDYILSKLPKVLTSVVAINYKYSNHKSVIAKI